MTGRSIKERGFRVGRTAALLDALQEEAGLSRTEAKRLLRFRAVSVNGRSAVRHDTPVAPGDAVTFVLPRGAPAFRAPEAPDWFPRIVHEDDAIVVVDKPAGLLTIASETEKSKTAYRALNEHLKARLRTSRQQIFVVHRLDQDTSGLVVFARTEAAKRALQDGWRNVRRIYRAIVEGVPEQRSGTLKTRLAETKSLLVHEGGRDGRIAVTRYEVLRSGAARALLEVEIETGRRNQIRVQLAGIGHPVVGDRKYGPAGGATGRLALHACELAFDHPVSGEAMRFRSEVPPILSRLLEAPASHRVNRRLRPLRSR